MKTAALLIVGVALIAVPLFAGEYLMNDTGQTVYGLTVTFSEPVTITGFGDVLMAVEPTGESTSFTFSGGALEVWDGHWLNWEPASAQLVSHQWLFEALTSRGDSSWWETEQIWAFTQDFTALWLQRTTTARRSELESTLNLYLSLGLDVAAWNCLSWDAGWKSGYADFVRTMHDRGIRVVGSFSGLTQGWENPALHEEDLSPALLVGPFGSQQYHDVWGQRYPTYSVLHPARQRFILSYLENLIDCGVDAISVDELAYGSLFYPDFTQNTLDLFNDYLSDQYSAFELDRLATEYGFESFTEFDFAAVVRSVLPSSIREVDRANWGAVQWEYDMPLRDDYYRFIHVKHHEFTEWLVSAIKQYALDTRGYEIPVSANINTFTAPEAFMVVNLLDYVDLEWFYHDLGYPPSARGFPSLKMAQAVRKRGMLLTGMDTRPDLRDRGPEGSLRLIKLLIADAYAADGVFYIEEGAHDMHFDMAALAPFWQFVKARPQLFENLTRVPGSIAVLQLYESLDSFRGTDYRGLCHLLADCGYQFSAILGSTDELVPYPLTLNELKRYDAVLIPELSKLEEENAEVLLAYVRSGGTIVAFAEPRVLNWGRSGAAKTFFSYLKRGESRVGAGTIIHVDHLLGGAYLDEASDEIRAELMSVVGGIDLTPEVEFDLPHLCSAFAYTGEDSCVIHLVNYDYALDGDRIDAVPSQTVSIHMAGIPPADDVTAVWYTPESDPIVIKHACLDGVVSVALPEFYIWGVLLLTSKPEPVFFEGIDLQTILPQAERDPTIQSREPSDASVLLQTPSVELMESLEPSDGAFVVDDFEGLGSRIGGTYDHDSDPTDSDTHFDTTIGSDSSANHYRIFDYTLGDWLKVRLSQIPAFDASEYSGIELTIWADAPLTIDWEVAFHPQDQPWTGVWLNDMVLGDTPKRYRLPFDNFEPVPSRTLLGSLVAITFWPESESGRVYWDDLALYR